DLSQVRDAELIPVALASALGLQHDTEQPLLDAATEMLASAQALLVLDNCEHLLTACAHLVDRLLADCSALRVLATTRQPLGLGGATCQPIAGLEHSEAVRLFVERALAVGADCGIAVDNSGAVASIVACLGALPL